MKSSENKRKYTANIVTYINGKTLKEINLNLSHYYVKL